MCFAYPTHLFRVVNTYFLRIRHICFAYPTHILGAAGTYASRIRHILFAYPTHIFHVADICFAWPTYFPYSRHICRISDIIPCSRHYVSHSRHKLCVAVFFQLFPIMLSAPKQLQNRDGELLSSLFSVDFWCVPFSCVSKPHMFLVSWFYKMFIFWHAPAVWYFWFCSTVSDFSISIKTGL